MSAKTLKILEDQAKYFLERASERIDEKNYGIAESLLNAAIENLENASELKIKLKSKGSKK